MSTEQSPVLEFNLDGAQTASEAVAQSKNFLKPAEEAKAGLVNARGSKKTCLSLDGSCSPGGMMASVAARVRVGFSLALAIVFAIGGMAACAKYSVLDRYGDLIRLGIGAAGFVLWLVGILAESRGRQARGGQSSRSEPQHPLAFFRGPRGWGIILVLTAAAHAVANHLYRAPAARAEPVPVKVARPAPQVVFPPLKLQGLAVNGARSSALINGEVLYLGEGIGNVRLVAVEPEQVKVELGGQTNVLRLRF